MKTISLIFFLLIFTTCFSQRADCYLPNGVKCPENKNVGKSMYEISKKFEPKSRTYFRSPKESKAFVVFKAFTREPLYVLTNENKSSTKEEISNIIKNVDFDYYFGSYNSGLKADLKKFIQAKDLTDSFILDTMGSPTDTKEIFREGKTVRYMEYTKYNIRIYFLNSIAVSYDEL